MQSLLLIFPLHFPSSTWNVSESHLEYCLLQYFSVFYRYLINIVFLSPLSLPTCLTVLQEEVDSNASPRASNLFFGFQSQSSSSYIGKWSGREFSKKDFVNFLHTLNRRWFKVTHILNILNTKKDLLYISTRNDVSKIIIYLAFETPFIQCR